MPFSLSWTENKSLFTVKHFRAVTITEIRQSLAEISQLADPIMRPYLLVDHVEVTEFPDKAELALFNESHYRQPRVTRATAFVVNKVTAAPVDFLLLSGRNRGMLASAFTDTTEAIRWLLAHDSPGS